MLFSLLAFELDGFLCVAFGVFDFDCFWIVIAVNLYSQYGFFQWLTIVILKIRILIPINPEKSLFHNPYQVKMFRIFLAIFINIYTFYRDILVWQWLFIFINDI